MKAKLLNPTKGNAAPMLEHFAAVNKRARLIKQAAEPEVGIFFLYDGRVLVDGTPVSLAEPYGTFKGHLVGHHAYWRTLQRVNVVPRDVEYEEVPRGRVGYDTQEHKFYIFADPCILKDERAMDEVVSQFNLPSHATAPPRKDSHYKCPGCRKKTKKQLNQEEADWNF